MTLKSYDNPEFMRGEAARPLRVLSEYLEPKTRLEAHGVHRAITFWGSARLRAGVPQVDDGRDYFAMARNLGRRLARWTTDMHAPDQRYHILTGGGPGIMEAAHAGAAEVDRELNVGLNISLPFEQARNPYIPDHLAFEFHYFFMRKFWFLNLSRAVVIFPGGFGTLDELFEMLTLIQTGKADAMPVILFGQAFWQRTINLESLAEQGLVSEADLLCARHVDDVDEAFEALTHRL